MSKIEITYTGTVIGIQVDKEVLDLAMECAVGNGDHDVFIDMETVGDRFPQCGGRIAARLREVIDSVPPQTDFLHLYGRS
jgi:hypothetical protein